MLRRILKRGLTVIALSFLVLNLFSALSLAQEKSLKVSEVKVDIWPEYDRKTSIMVQYGGQFTDKNALPAEVNFFIPKDAEDIHACAVTEAEEHQCQAYERDEVNGLVKLSYKLTLPNFSVMFYAPLPKSGAQKNFTFLYRNSYPTDKVTVNIQQPLKATNFKVSPVTSQVSTDDKNFKYHLYSYDGVSPNKEMEFKVSYAKSDPSPSVEGGTQTSGAATPSGSKANLWIVLAVIAGLIILPLGGYFIATARTGAFGGRTRTRFTPPPPKPKKKKAGRFCTNCGTLVSFADNFCPSCGSRVKK